MAQEVVIRGLGYAEKFRTCHPWVSITGYEKKEEGRSDKRNKKRKKGDITVLVVVKKGVGIKSLLFSGTVPLKAKLEDK